MPRVAVDVPLKREILDPQGRAITEALPALGYAGVGEVRIGKHLEFDVTATGDALDTLMQQMCHGFLTNPVIESYRWRIISDDERADA